MIQMLLACLMLYANVPIQALHLFDSSSHFQIFCENGDHPIAHECLEIAEALYDRLTSDLNRAFTQQLRIHIFPSLTAFQESMGCKGFPDWVVAKATSQTIDIVSPLNPGSYHTAESIKKILMLNVVKAFLYQTFDATAAPFWLVFGIASNKTDYSSAIKLPTNLPSLEELETADNQTFGEIGGFQCSLSFVSFIVSNYGWNKIFQILENYDIFEELIGAPKNHLYNQWIDFVSAMAD